MNALDLKTKAIEILDGIASTIPAKIQPLLKGRIAKINRQLDKLKDEASELIAAIGFNQDNDY